MLRNYFKIAWRNLKKQPFFTFLNTFGLAIGMAGGLLIALYIYDELSFDKMFADSDRIHRINGDVKFGGKADEFAVSPAPMAEVLLQDYSQIEMTTRFRTIGSLLIKKSGHEQNVKEFQSTFVDSTFFDMFGIDLLFGDVHTALSEPNTLILTKTAAEKHFQLEEAVGQSLILDNDDTYMVTGVIDDLPTNSFLREYGVFMAMSGYEDAQVYNWGSNNYQTFLKVIPGTDLDYFQVQLQSILGKYVIPGVQDYFPGITEEAFLAAGNYLKYSTIPLTDIHLSSNRVAEISTNNDIQSLYILSFIGLFLILLASVNFMNLSTAQSLKRAKEVGVRKTLGSSKLELISQFLTESGLISLISLLLAIVIAAIALPYFNELADKNISLPYTSPFFWLALLLSTLFLGFLSGIYPAFFMSRFTTVDVLKGGKGSATGGGFVRNSLVVFQFSISIFLIVSTLIVSQQLEFIQGKDLGFSKDQILVVDDVYGAGDQMETFKKEVKQLALVENASLSSYLPTPSSRSDNGYAVDGRSGQENVLQMQNWRVDYDYAPTLDMEIIAGRNFDPQFSTDSSAVIINEAAVAILGMEAEEVLNMRLTRELGSENEDFLTVIGVVKDFHFQTMKEDIEALCMVLGSRASKLIVKLNPGDFSNTISSIEKIWKTVAVGQPFNHYFMEESFNSTYESEQRLGRIFITFTILSLIIACLGLFGLTAFSAEKRSKEIGIRKVLGASVSQITYLLSKDFLKLVSVAVLVAVPLGWYAMDRWLQDFSYRIEIGWEVFVLAALLAVVISVLTVSYQSIKAAMANPVESLKTE